jgi:hypothetical protein
MFQECEIFGAERCSEGPTAPKGQERMRSQSASCSRRKSCRPRKTTLVLLPGLDGTEVFFKPLVAALPTWIKPVVVTYATAGANDYSNLLPVVRRGYRRFQGVLRSGLVVFWTAKNRSEFAA